MIPTIITPTCRQLLACSSSSCPPPAIAQKGAVAQASTDGDAVLSAMRAELERSKTQLKMEQVAAPYFIEYRVVDLDVYSAEAAFGALRTDLRSRMRFLRVVVRVGDYKQDSYFGLGEGSLDFMPLDNDMLALRHELWLATDRAYKAAAESLTAKQAQLKQLTVDQPVDDFAHADAVRSIGPLATLEFDPQPWKKMLQDASAVYKSDPAIESFESRLQFSGGEPLPVEHRRHSGAKWPVALRDEHRLQHPGARRHEPGPHERIQCFQHERTSARRRLRRARQETGGHAEGIARRPVADEDYRGPVLFSADASASIFADLVGENVLGRKPGLGKNSRTTGAFAASYKTRILPDFLSVVDDPTIANYSGQSLLGHYEIDDEGVPAERVSLIEKGNLVNYVIGREPIRDFPASNGHGRARIPSNPAGPSLGNLIVTSAQPVSKDALKKRLIELCQQRDLPYCYYVETFGPKLAPRLIYRVWTKDGREELVRGAAFGDLDIRALRSDLIAAGDDVYVDSEMQNIPHSIVAPSVLFDELEVKRANLNKEKLPEYPAPAVAE